MKTSSTSRLPIPMFLILAGTAGGAALLTSRFPPDTHLSLLLPLLAALVLIAGGLCHISLRRTSPPPASAKDEATFPVTTSELERLKAAYIASMSHELRTPLNAIMGFTGVILQGMSGEVTERQRDQLERVIDSARKLLSGITDIMEIARIDTGDAVSFPTTFSLNTLIGEMVHELGARDNLPDFSEITIKTDVPPQIEAHADRKKLKQCLTNLVVCIVEYTQTNNIAIAAHESGDCLNIIITISQQEKRQRTLAKLFHAREEGKGTVQKAGCDNLRLYLTAKMITEHLGGGISLDTETSLRISFSAETTPASRQSHRKGPLV